MKKEKEKGQSMEDWEGPGLGASEKGRAITLNGARSWLWTSGPLFFVILCKLRISFLFSMLGYVSM